MKINKKPYTKTKKILLISTGVAVVLAVIVGVIVLYRQQDRLTDNTIDTKSTDTIKIKPDDVSGSSPTNISNQENAKGDTDISVKKADAVPIVTGYGIRGDNIDISAMITGIIDNGGQCTAMITWASGVRKVVVDASAGPSSTTCANAQISLEAIAEDEPITISISYASAKYVGTSSNNPTVTIKEMRT